MANVNQTLKQRNKTHGSFETHAMLSQQLKNACRNHNTGKEKYPFYSLDAVQVEGLEMILHKVARILNGDPNESDHWHDIAGYASLVDTHCLELTDGKEK